MGRKGLYSEKKKVTKKKAAMFQTMAPAGKASTDPHGDVANALFMIGIGGACHLWSKTTFTMVMFVLLCLVAIYVGGRGIKTIIKGNGDNKNEK